MVSIFRNKLLAIMFVSSFLLGWVGGNVYSNFSDLGLQKPLSMLELNNQKNSPSDRLKDHNIKILEDRVVIYINEPYLAKFTDTHSMEPLLDKKSTGIEIVPKSSDEIKVGDIISYASKYDEGIIIHRVVKIGRDSEGWYAITKGDNNQGNDPEKIRFSQVKRILVGVLY